MQIKSLSLKNIRSYSDLNLEFKRGSTLLSGDIGSGKTTVLLSIEFALFGLMKGMLSGGALLRHGAKEGSVKLTFLLDGKTGEMTGGEKSQNEITIFRTLKRTGSSGSSTGSSITQDAGYIEINRERKDLTPVEMKSQILSLLGYPDELLTKSKSLIFRYTVYTPQEEMKQIILDGEEERLEKLTKIFNVEKYKRVRENAEVYARELRAETRIHSLLEKELDELKEIHRKYETEMEEKNISLLKLQQQIAAEEKAVKENESKMKGIEDSLKRHNQIKQELSIAIVEEKNLRRTAEQAKHDLNILETQKKRMGDELDRESKEDAQKKTRTMTEISDEMTNYRDRKEETEKRIIEAKSKLGTLARRKEESEELKQKIVSLEKCPMCQQEVKEGHKHFIEDEENKKIAEIAEKELRYDELQRKAESNLSTIMKRLEALQIELLEANNQENKGKQRKRQQLQLDELEKDIQKKKEKIAEGEKETLTKTAQQEALKKKLDESLIDEKIVDDVTKLLKESQDNHLSLKMKEAGTLQSIKENALNLESNEKGQEKKKEQLTLVERKKKLEHWLSNHFLNLMDVIEKHVMASIHAEFKSYFEDWFSMLIEEESITATIDERFNPKVSQNGYDADIENLSGGEKTSVALAYKLALNKVINTMMGTIKTKDLIILDEPTDGFSSHQLDKVREVLDALHSKQTIIVSHESKMESFVDHIIHLRKHEHQSEIMS